MSFWKKYRTKFNKNKQFRMWTILALIFGILTLISTFCASNCKDTLDNTEKLEAKNTQNKILEQLQHNDKNVRKLVNSNNIDSEVDNKERYEGIAVLLQIKILKNQGRDRKFIFDAGNQKYNRISVYFDNMNNLCFRVIDINSEAHTVIMQRSKYNLFDKYNIFLFEIGTSHSYSFIRVTLNGEIEVKNTYDYKINFNSNLNIKEDITMGSDINIENFGNFYMTCQYIYNETLTLEGGIESFKLLQKQKINKSVYFDGTASLKTNKKVNNNNNLESIKTNPPTLHLENTEQLT